MKYTITFLKQLIILTIICFGRVSAANESDLLELSVEELLNVEVISVAKKAKSLNDSPAAVFVISQDDIKRVGATSIPEALRLAPGVDVARIDANKWAVSARGFNGRFANKLLVLIDGRNAYTRAFSGVYWENQDVMLEDVERIEVVRGPGAALWGANAVNGVINIITKNSEETLGGLFVAGGGTEEQGFGAFRYGAKLNTDTTGRMYVKGFKKDEGTNESNGGAEDDWSKVQGGFRVDSQFTVQDYFTIQGDAFSSDINQNSNFPTLTAPYLNNVNENIDSFGGNILVRHQHTFSSTSNYSLQVFYDFYQRDELFVKEARDVIDVDFQHQFGLLEWNDVIWGVGYRYNHDYFKPNNTSTLYPLSRDDQLFSAFIQDEITILDDILWLTIGSKFEHNDYSGFEVQPTARLMWAPHQQHRVWGAVSRSVRTPSRLEHDMNVLHVVIPASPPSSPAVIVRGQNSRRFTSEEVLSYEMGYRTTFIKNVSIDFTAFFNNYRRLRSFDLDASRLEREYIEQSYVIRNSLEAKTYGFEIATVWQMLDWWRWDANYSLLKIDYNRHDGVNQLGSSPQQRVSVRSAMSLWEYVDFDLLFRYVDENIANSTSGTAFIKDYFSIDIRLAWRVANDIEMSLVGQNLLADKHLEFRQEALTIDTSIDRGVYGKLVWQF